MIINTDLTVRIISDRMENIRQSVYRQNTLVATDYAHLTGVRVSMKILERCRSMLFNSHDREETLSWFGLDCRKTAFMGNLVEDNTLVMGIKCRVVIEQSLGYIALHDIIPTQPTVTHCSMLLFTTNDLSLDEVVDHLNALADARGAKLKEHDIVYLNVHTALGHEVWFMTKRYKHENF